MTIKERKVYPNGDEIAYEETIPTEWLTEIHSGFPNALRGKYISMSSKRSSGVFDVAIQGYAGFKKPVKLMSTYKLRFDLNTQSRWTEIYSNDLLFPWPDTIGITLDEVDRFYTSLMIDESGNEVEYTIYLPPIEALAERYNVDISAEKTIGIGIKWSDDQAPEATVYINHGES